MVCFLRPQGPSVIITAGTPRRSMFWVNQKLEPEQSWAFSSRVISDIIFCTFIVALSFLIFRPVDRFSVYYFNAGWCFCIAISSCLV